MVKITATDKEVKAIETVFGIKLPAVDGMLEGADVQASFKKTIGGQPVDIEVSITPS